MLENVTLQQIHTATTLTHEVQHDPLQGPALSCPQPGRPSATATETTATETTTWGRQKLKSDHTVILNGSRRVDDLLL